MPFAESAAGGSAARGRTAEYGTDSGQSGLAAMIRFLDFSNHVLFWYYLASNIAYLMMLIVALKTSAAHQRRLESHRLPWIKESPMAPPITIIAPAHNRSEERRVGK